MVESDDFFDCFRVPLFEDRQAHAAAGRQEGGLALQGRAALPGAEGMDEKAQAPLRRYRRVFLAQGAGRAVARIDEGCLAASCFLLVDGQEIFF